MPRSVQVKAVHSLGSRYGKRASSEMPDSSRDMLSFRAMNETSEESADSATTANGSSLPAQSMTQRPLESETAEPRRTLLEE